MSMSVNSIRKRLLQCLTHAELVSLANISEGDRRGNTTLIAHILNHWDLECDTAILGVTMYAMSNKTRPYTPFKRKYTDGSTLES